MGIPCADRWRPTAGSWAALAGVPRGAIARERIRAAGTTVSTAKRASSSTLKLLPYEA
jgi:hypothetical protein